MDIRTLPEAERDIYNRLKKDYSLHFQVTKINGQALRFLTPSNLDELLEGDSPLENPGTFPFWFKLWETDLVLAHVLLSHPEPTAKKLLELGAGLGRAGIAAAGGGFKVTLSDKDGMALDFQRVSCAANGVSGVESIKIDLLDPPELETFDVIGGADILFREEFVEPMLTICQNCLKPGGTVYLAHDVRRRSLPLFLEKAEQHFVIGSKKQRVSGEGKTSDILVNRLQWRH